MPSGDKPLHEKMLTVIYIAMTHFFTACRYWLGAVKEQAFSSEHFYFPVCTLSVFHYNDNKSNI